MRKLVAALFISLDGIVESPGNWQFDYFDEDMLKNMSSALAAEDTILLGRITYQEWSRSWPTSTNEPYASHINNTRKYVVSSTLNKVTWGKFANISLIKGDLRQEIIKLKEQPGNTIGVAGSPTLVLSLLQANLLDELTLMLYPVIAGTGKRLFKDKDQLQRMQLLDSKRTKPGIMLLTYGHYTKEDSSKR